MKPYTPLFGLEALWAVASGVPVLVSNHCGVASFFLTMKEKDAIVSETNIRELVKQSIVSETENWAKRIVEHLNDTAKLFGRAELLKKYLLFDTSISSSQLEFNKIIAGECSINYVNE